MARDGSAPQACAMQPPRRGHRKYAVWSMADFANVSLAYDCDSIPIRLQKPQIVEVAKLEMPVRFPLKDAYEKANATIEGIEKGKELKGNSEAPLADEGQEGEIDYDPDVDAPVLDSEEGPGGERLLRIDELFPDDAEDPDTAPDAEKLAIKHWSEGKAGDGVVYLNDDMEHCKIDKRGTPYKVGEDGRKLVPSGRPVLEYSPEEWRALGGSGRSKVIKEKKLEEKKKDDAKKRERKKKKDSAVAATGPRSDCGVTRKDHHIAVPGIVNEDKEDDRIDSQYEKWPKILFGEDYGLTLKHEGWLAKGEGSDFSGAVPDEPSRRGNPTWVSPSAVFNTGEDELTETMRGIAPAMPCSTTLSQGHREKLSSTPLP